MSQVTDSKNARSRPTPSSLLNEPAGRRFFVAHRETQTELPLPLSAPDKIHLGATGIPATVISVLSIVTLAITYLILQASPQLRLLLQLPFSPIIPVVLAWGLIIPVLLECRARPGSLIPRIWALALFSALSLMILIFVFDERRGTLSWFHAFSWSLLMSVLMLVPRLTPLRSDSRLLQLIPLAAVSFLVVLVLPLSCAVGNVSIGAYQSEIDAELERMREWTNGIRTTVDYDWRRMPFDLQGATSRIEKLRSLSFLSLRIGDPKFWRTAGIVSRQEELTDAWRRLVETVVEGYNPAASPSLTLPEVAFVGFDPNRWEWYTRSDLKLVSTLVDNYYWHLNRLFWELRVERPGSIDQSSLVEYFTLEERALGEYMRDLSRSWYDHWVVFRLPDSENRIGTEPPSLDRLLTAAFGSAFELDVPTVHSFSPELADARQFAEAGRCSFTESSSLPRVDCVAYRPSDSGLGADIGLGIHLQYGVAEAIEGPLSVGVVLLVPATEDRERIKDLVRQALALQGGSIGELTAESSASVDGGDPEGQMLQVGFTVWLERPVASSRSVGRRPDN